MIILLFAEYLRQNLDFIENVLGPDARVKLNKGTLSHTAMSTRYGESRHPITNHSLLSEIDSDFLRIMRTKLRWLYISRIGEISVGNDIQQLSKSTELFRFGSLNMYHNKNFSKAIVEYQVLESHEPVLSYLEIRKDGMIYNSTTVDLHFRSENTKGMKMWNDRQNLVKISVTLNCDIGFKPKKHKPAKPKIVPINVQFDSPFSFPIVSSKNIISFPSNTVFNHSLIWDTVTVGHASTTAGLKWSRSTQINKNTVQVLVFTDNQFMHDEYTFFRNDDGDIAFESKELDVPSILHKVTSYLDFEQNPNDQGVTEFLQTKDYTKPQFVGDQLFITYSGITWIRLNEKWVPTYNYLQVAAINEKAAEEYVMYEQLTKNS
ncbi:hypothetical protein D3C78_20300 [compost metagenome]